MRVLMIRTLTVGASALIASAIATATACSSPTPTAQGESPSLDGGAAVESGIGSSPDGGPPSADGGGDANAPQTQQAACEAYVAAWCAKAAACGVRIAGCDDEKNACPGVLFAAGSTHTVAGVNACSTAISDTYSCDDVASSDSSPLDCDPPGTRKEHESCGSGFQCESDVCIGTPGQCGICAKLALANESCEGAVQCVKGTLCDSTAHRCVAAGAGAPCVDGERCARGLFCGAATLDAPGRCTALPPPGAPCIFSGPPGARSQFCVSPAYCKTPPDYRQQGICVPSAKVGEPCGRDGMGYLVECDYRLQCGPSGKCIVPVIASLGQTCDTFTTCDPSTYCDGPPGQAGTCAPHLAVNATCGAPDAGPSQTCGVGSCVTDECLPSSFATGKPATCVAGNLSLGAACGMGCLGRTTFVPLGGCSPGLACKAGRCTPPDLSSCE